MAVSVVFCILISSAVWLFAEPLMLLFVSPQETAVIAEGVRYLHIEGAFYCGIGCLFLLYGLYRALGKPGMSVVLTVISLGRELCWLIYFQLCRLSESWESGGRCLLAGLWLMQQDFSIMQ